jgi:SAM-dependent methyltransferase
MLVMAIEAAKQLADVGRPITGFNIKDATFQSTLNVPVRPEGIETQLYMRPTKASDEKDAGWFDFRLCTYNDNAWSENCKGSIQVVYEHIETEIDGGKELREWRRYHQRGYANALKSCATPIDSAFMYNHLEKCGYQYGPAFKPLTALTHNGTDEATAEVRTFQWSSHEESSFAQPHTIHPTTFDGILQMIIVVFSKGGHELMPTIVPTHIEKLWLSSTGLSHPATDFVKVFAKTKLTGIRETTSSIVTLDEDAREVLMTIEGAKTAVVSSHETSNQLQVVENKLCYNVEWKPDVDLLTKEQTQMYCEQAFQAAEKPIQFYEDVDFLLTVFITRAIGPMLGRDPEGLEPHVRKYLDWMVHQKELLNGNLSPFSPSDWKHRMNDTVYINELCDRIEGTCAQGKFYVTVGRNLLAILSGELDPLNLLFQGDLVKDHYFEVVCTKSRIFMRFVPSLDMATLTNILACPKKCSSVPCLKPFARYLDALTHKNPSLKILEVGAGTGGMTVQIMKILAVHGENELDIPRYAQYDYTDISRSFFGPAHDKFVDHGKRLNFKALNIEKDPEIQGFECGTYDMVVAASVSFLRFPMFSFKIHSSCQKVLHATTNLAVTLKNVRKLLKP